MTLDGKIATSRANPNGSRRRNRGLRYISYGIGGRRRYGQRHVPARQSAAHRPQRPSPPPAPSSSDPRPPVAGRSRTRCLDLSLQPRALVDELYGREIQSFLLECGPDLAFNALEAGIIDKIVVFVAPRILGGRETPVIGWRRRRTAGRHARNLTEWRLRRSGPTWSSQHMFTGIIEEVGEIVEIDESQEFRTIRVRVHKLLDDLKPGSSIAVNGVCLTVRAPQADGFSAELSAETLQRTSLGQLRDGAVVNLERPMRADSRFGGHIVQGHVDGTGQIRHFTETPAIGISKSRFRRRRRSIYRGKGLNCRRRHQPDRRRRCGRKMHFPSQ